MNSPDAPPGTPAQTRPDPARIKSLFGEILDARDDNQYAHAARLLREAPTPLGRAVEALLHAHGRASGVLLDDTVAPSGAGRASHADQPVPTIEGYEIGDEIGRGGFGIVYRARQRTPIDRPVAIKVLRRELVSDEAIARFGAESTLLARMNHESIARVYDAGLTGQGQPFVAMELIDAGPLNRVCESVRPDTRQLVGLMAQICDAVHHAHQRAVIHRDLKPANILVEQHHNTLRPRVIDFGIAKLLGGNPDNPDSPDRPHTHAHVRLGTPRYMSPEQRTGATASDTRVDIYALGAILCELLAGDVPTAAPASTAERDSHITRPSKIASEHTGRTIANPKALRGDLDRIVLKACAEDPDRRYPSAQEMGDDLRRYLDGRPVSASPPGVVYLTGKFVRRHRASVSLAGVLSIALIVSMGVAALKWREAGRQRDRARASSERVAFIGDFLLDMLLLTADSNARGAPTLLTQEDMQEIADRAAEGLDDDPQRMLSMLAGIGQFQAQSGYPRAGTDTLRKALGFAIEYHGIPSPEVVDLRLRLHDLLWGHGLGGTKEQITLADQESAELFGDDDPRRLRVLQRSQGSIENLQRIVSVYETMPDIDPSDHYNALFALSMQQRFSQTPGDQLGTTRKLYEVARAHYPPKHSAVIDSMALYGEAMSTYAPSEEAATLLKAAYDRSVGVFGYDHFTTESVRRGLARIYGKLGRPGEGIPYALDDLESAERSYGSDSIQYANALHELGVLYRYDGKYEQALAPLEQALALRRTQWTPGHAQIATTQIVLSQVLYELGEHERAERLIDEIFPYIQDLRSARSYAAANRVRIQIHRDAGDQAGADGLIDSAREHMRALGMTPQQIRDVLTD